MAKTETRTELLNRAFIYIIVIGFGVLIILQVSPLLFDLFVSLVLASIAEPLVIRIESYIGRPFSAFISVLLVLLIITLTLLSIIPIMVSQFYELTTQIPMYFDSIIQIVENNQLINFDININFPKNCSGIYLKNKLRKDRYKIDVIELKAININ